MTAKDKIQIKIFFESTLEAIKRFKLLQTPENYRLWFEYEAGLSPALKVDIDKLLEDKVCITEDICRKLYKEHIENREAGALDSVNIAIREMMEVIIDHLSTWDQSATKFNAALVECSLRLESDPTIEEIKEIINTVTFEAKEMSRAHQGIQSTLVTLNDEISDLRSDVDRLETEVLTDPLTQVANRRAFDDDLEKQINSSRKKGQALALIMVDIDLFKRVNDEFGHQVGDKIIQFFSTMMAKNIRRNDCLFRYGGEEFAIILPDTEIKGAAQLAENLRRVVSSRVLKTGSNGQIVGKVTMSLGVASLREQENSEDFIGRTDKQLYNAKKLGRNRVCFDTD